MKIDFDKQDEVLIELHGYKRRICPHTNIPETLTKNHDRPIYHISDQEIDTISIGFKEAIFEDIYLKCALKDILSIIYYKKLSIPSIGLYDGIILIQWYDGYSQEDEIEMTIRLETDCTVIFWNNDLAFNYPKQINDIYNKMISSKTLQTKINQNFL
jgi:hypothetical protein